MGKTETIKDRAIYVYLPSIDMAERWKKMADEAGTSVSKFVAEHVLNSLKQQEEDDYRSRNKLLEEIRDLKEVLEEKDERVRHLELLVEKLEEDLRRYRSQPFTEDDYMGDRSINRRLVEIVKEPGVHDNDEILSRLGIKPREVDAIKAVSKQLERLHSYGLIKSSPRGWKWKE